VLKSSNISSSDQEHSAGSGLFRLTNDLKTFTDNDHNKVIYNGNLELDVSYKVSLQ